jgi:hypothetical protein
MMTKSLYNFCWEFCHEIIFANPKENDQYFLIMNLPIRFGAIIQNKLLKEGFRCVSFMPHGHESVIMRFKNIKSTVEG